VIFKTGKKHLFLDISSTNVDTFVPSLYQCVKIGSIEVFDRCLSSHFCTSISASSSSVKHLPPKWFFSGPNRWKSLGAKSGLYKVDVQEVPTVVLEFSMGCSGCMGSGIVMMKK
jgi:hypothetical protein